MACPPPGSVPCQPFPQCLLPWPPLPLPPPPPLLTSDPAATVRFEHRHSSLVPTLPVAAASLVAAAVLAIVVTFFFLRLRRRRLGLLDAAPTGSDAPLEEEDGGDGEEDIHHVWYIRTVGLDESTIGTITAWAYKADDGVLAASATDCAVCLSEFCDGELVRLLPKCGHAFHVSCIDTWLRSHVNCPLCRAPVVVPNSAAIAGDPGTSTSTASSSSSSSDGSSLPSPESTLNHTEPNWTASAQVDSNRTDGDGRRLDHERGAMEEEVDAERSELGGRSRTAVDPIASPQLPVSIDIMENGLQPIRRSASMGAIIGALELEEGLFEVLRRKKPASEADWSHRTRVKHSSRVTCLRKEVERSSSGSSSERFFLSIRGRGRSSLLPL